MIYDLTDGDFDSYVLDGQHACLAQFWASWCGPCKQLFPVVVDIARHYEQRMDIVRINIDENPRIPQRYGVRGIPTLIAFIGGKAISTKVGSLPISKLLEWCDTFAPPEPVDRPTVETVAITVIDGQLRLVTLLRDGSYHFLDDTSRLHELVCRVTLDSSAMAKAIEEFEGMINDRSLKERDFQAFFTEYPDFLLNDSYRQAHSHIVLERPSGNLIPDFMLEPLDQAHLCDILDIKTPNAKLLNLKSNRIRYSSAVFEGVAQLREYQAYFDDERARSKIEERYQLLAYRPRLFLVIGRRGTVDPITMKRIRQDINGVDIQTFDDLLFRAKARLNGSAKKQ